MREIHGGDVYRNHVEMDFSVNINPLGVPEEVKNALHKAVEDCTRYPDIRAEKLNRAVSEMLDVSGEYLLFGNGASELFTACVHAVRPGKTVIPVPSFYGYEHAAEAWGGGIVYHRMVPERGDFSKESLSPVLTEDVDLLFLANPNNPTGKLTGREELRALLDHCRKKGICVVLDECFIEFCGGDCSMIRDVGQFENLILVRAFTKIFAIPGVRLGYLVCSSRALLEKIACQLPEWNISCFAQAAGCACAGQQAYIERTAAYVREERQFLEEGLERLGIRVFQSEAGFLLIYSEEALYERLLERGILIRDCSNFRGLSKGFYRIAVKTREENERLLETIGEIIWNGK